jgi:nucleoside-diphosphate-sugar epimerase
MSSRAVLVTGASSVVGDFLIPRLLEAGFLVHALSRRPAPRPVSGMTWLRADIAGPLPAALLPEAGVVFHLAPLWLLPPLVAPFAERGVTRLVAFGSTSRFTKDDSGDAEERDLARRLAAAEESLAAACAGSAVAWTVFRPTLIYDGRRDQNVAAIARFVRRFGFLPVAGAARGLRQPVHAEDLAAACVLALEAAVTRGRAYDLVGGSTLSFAEMAETVFRALGRKPRLVHLPLPLLRPLLKAASLLPGWHHLRAEMADRMNRDLCFDSTSARRDFGFSPRPFSFPVAP